MLRISIDLLFCIFYNSLTYNDLEAISIIDGAYRIREYPEEKPYTIELFSNISSQPLKG